jgi:hypothetical protein
MTVYLLEFQLPSCYVAVTWPLRGLQLPTILYAGAYSIGCCLLEDRGCIRDYRPIEFCIIHQPSRTMQSIPLRTHFFLHYCH